MFFQDSLKELQVQVQVNTENRITKKKSLIFYFFSLIFLIFSLKYFEKAKNYFSDVLNTKILFKKKESIAFGKRVIACPITSPTLFRFSGSSYKKSKIGKERMYS